MKITGTIVNYYFHCQRQCYLFANRINLEENSEDVRIGRIIHEIKAENTSDSEIKFENIALDNINSKYVIELKKSDSDVVASTMQLLFYLKVLKQKGIIRQGKLKFAEKNQDEKVEIIELTEENEKDLDNYLLQIDKLLNSATPPEVVKIKGCKKCAYYDYCYI